MRSNTANNIIVLGTTLFLVGFLIVVFSPANLTIFMWRIFGPPRPIGTAVSLVGLVLVVAGGYNKMN